MKTRIYFLISIILAGVILFTPALPVLAITNRKNNSEHYFSRDGYKNGFVISYTHSVNKGRVHDVYSVTEDKKLLLDRTIFVSYGAGIPEPEETPGAKFTVLENGYEISNLNRIVPKLTMAVGIIAEHGLTLYHHNVAFEYPFTDYFEPQTSITLEITRVNLVKYIFNKKIGVPHGRFRKRNSTFQRSN